MTHDIPFFGRAVFMTRAGENSRFYLQSETRFLAAGKAMLQIKTPIWSEQARQYDFGYVAVKEGLRPISLGSQQAESMLATLYDGLNMSFIRKPWHGGEVSTQVDITTVGFRPVYQRYLECLSSLLPVNFDQIKRTAVYFGSNQYEDIRPSELRKLDNIVRYMKADARVKEFFIDGHTDSVGTRESNLVLAENRANEITRYLVNKGVPESYITTRWHGERYPVAGNHSVAGRAKNRRVTIRLERLEPPKSL